MNKYVSPFALVVGLTLVAGWASAADPVVFDVTVVNSAREDLQLKRASWSFGRYEVADYMIPKHHTGVFRVTTTDQRKGRIVLDYSTGDKTCRFSGGIDQRRVGAWVIPRLETYSWSKVESVGNFRAYCQSSIKKKPQGSGYDLQFSIQ